MYLLEIDGKVLFTEFRDMLVIDGTKYEKQLDQIYTWLFMRGMLKSPGENKFKKLKGENDGVPDYEYITKKLRVFSFQAPEGGEIVFDGIIKNDNDQKQMISSMRKIKKLFLEEYRKGNVNIVIHEGETEND